MLTFFRRIRKGLLDGGHTSKYALYATGEISLVVIGILIALQINTWNRQVQDRKKEKEYLVNIRKDLLTDTTNLNRILNEVGKNLDAVVALIKFINQPLKEQYELPKSTTRSDTQDSS